MPEQATIHSGEDVLDEQFPVYPGYAYVGDGRVIFSMLEGTVADLKRDAEVSEIRRCNMAARCMF